MIILITAILDAGRSAVDIAIFTFLPLMIVTFSLMRYLESVSALRPIAGKVNPLFRLFGLDGFGVLAIIQLSLVSSAAPVAALRLMAHKRTSEKFIAAAFAAVLAAAPANASFPLASLGVDPGSIIINGICGALVASTLAGWIVGRRSLPGNICSCARADDDDVGRRDLLTAINRGGADAIGVIAAILPVLVISLALVRLAQSTGALSAFTSVAQPLLQLFGASQQDVLFFLTKCLAGSSATVTLLLDAHKELSLPPEKIIHGSAFLLNPLDLPGLSILIVSVPALRSVAGVAVFSALAGILVRTALLSWL
ncbi:MULTISPECIES: hypothetical protein [Rhizobium]|uniref:hypothetical protein n=1 Tax=Rhizobium TaxID=379 RepID=UPI0007EACD13|nr:MULTISPECIES: hypothetical protein [Rhizobium]ANK90975.1 hypothetical protein AMK01_CH01473 [Rhizobium sp. N6212]ANK97004.1 hypothetical protein AMK00_CH01475 [Rhizobium sp. N621]ANL03124.1 hypothetical protein AMJ99_CH01543 [Rhizobium esperanzae]ANL09173.1 hypothetical protein AMJ98_CH01464 [Rhizobium sp. N1341]ANL21219.1 hypothetical protein AMJ96_CH01467 [Rhizobium sp. N113]